jgi:hypothetical protein
MDPRLDPLKSLGKCPFLPIIDEKTGYRYFWNPSTNESVWEISKEMEKLLKLKQELPKKKLRFNTLID